MPTIEQMISQEVLICVSSLVSTLAESGIANVPSHEYGPDIRDLADQALELASPVLDYEGAAREAGWRRDKRTDGVLIFVYRDVTASDEPDWEALCALQNIRPHEREVFEHWAVTTWFADQLEAAGEKVDKDFAGMCVWARTTTGQAIEMDAVIKRIHAATMAA